MYQVDEQPETLHIYVIREEAPKAQLFPIFLSVLALASLVALSVLSSSQQPVTRAVIRVPAVLLPQNHRKESAYKRLVYTAYSALLGEMIHTLSLTPSLPRTCMTSIFTGYTPNKNRKGNMIGYYNRRLLPRFNRPPGKQRHKALASRASKNPEEFLLRAGYVRCSVCGWAMGARTDPRHDTFCYRCRNHGSIVSKALDSVIWHKVEELADHVTLIEQAIRLATHDKKLERDASAIDASMVRWQTSANNYLEDLKDPKLTGDSRAGIRSLMNDANIMVRKARRREGAKAQIKAGLIDREREQATCEEILAWCKEVKEARCELSYQRTRDFLEMLGVVVTIYYGKNNHEGSTYDMRVRLPALQELIRLPDSELVTPTLSNSSVGVK